VECYLRPPQRGGLLAISLLPNVYYKVHAPVITIVLQLCMKFIFDYIRRIIIIIILYISLRFAIRV